MNAKLIYGNESRKRDIKLCRRKERIPLLCHSDYDDDKCYSTVVIPQYIPTAEKSTKDEMSDEELINIQFKNIFDRMLVVMIITISTIIIAK